MGAIEELAAEIERLRAERDDAVRHFLNVSGTLGRVEAERDRLRDRLALAAEVRVTSPSPDRPDTIWLGCGICVSIQVDREGRRPYLCVRPTARLGLADGQPETAAAEIERVAEERDGLLAVLGEIEGFRPIEGPGVATPHEQVAAFARRRAREALDGIESDRHEGDIRPS